MIGKVEMLISIIRKRQLKWCGHVTRHNDTLPFANNITHDSAPGKRARGRSRVLRIQKSKDYIELAAIEAVRAAQERNY